MLLLEAMGAAGIAFVFEKGLDAIGIPDLFSIAAAIAIFVALLGTVLKYTENSTYLLYLLSDTIWTWEFSHRERPEWDQRIDRFAQHLVNVARGSDAEEIVIVGHSSGIVPGHRNAGARAQARSRARPARPAHRAADDRRQFPDRRFPRRCRRISAIICAMLAVEPSIDWIDCQSRKDVMNFYPFDPIAGHGIDVGASQTQSEHRAGPVPRHHQARALRVFRWQFFRVHFQFVMANERPHAYDFFMIVCGPIPLSERMAAPDAALAIATGDAAAREWAWKRIETAESSPSGCRRIGRNGTFRPPQRLKSRGFSMAPPGTRLVRRVGFGPLLWCKAWQFYGLLRAACRRFPTAVSTSNS